jgi:hypothetical protein
VGLFGLGALRLRGLGLVGIKLYLYSRILRFHPDGDRDGDTKGRYRWVNLTSAMRKGACLRSAQADGCMQALLGNAALHTALVISTQQHRPLMSLSL